jgi:hypothetical protein
VGEAVPGSNLTIGLVVVDDMEYQQPTENQGMPVVKTVYHGQTQRHAAG